MRDYYSPIQRLLLIIDACAGGSQARFSEATGIIPPTITRMKQGRLKLNEDKIQAICTAYPVVNAQFLRDGTSYPGDISVEVVRDRLNKAIEERDKIIATLRTELELNQKILAKMLQ